MALGNGQHSQIGSGQCALVCLFHTGCCNHSTGRGATHIRRNLHSLLRWKASCLCSLPPLVRNTSRFSTLFLHHKSMCKHSMAQSAKSSHWLHGTLLAQMGVHARTDHLRPDKSLLYDEILSHKWCYNSTMESQPILAHSVDVLPTWPQCCIDKHRLTNSLRDKERHKAHQTILDGCIPRATNHQTSCL